MHRISGPTISLVALLCLLPAGRIRAQAADAVFEAGGLRIRFDSAGRVRSVYDLREQQEYIDASHPPGALLTRDLGSSMEQPVEMTVAQGGTRLVLRFPGEGVAATVSVKTHPTHLAFELTALSGPLPEKIRWGPFPTTIRQTIGETVGVVRNGQFAFGIQGLNHKTFGSARETASGSMLQAYTRDRTRTRQKSMGDVKDFTVPPLPGPDATLEGSRIALFGCPASEALASIGQIEVAEGLPHPLLDGVWAKVSPEATRSYVILPFGEKNLDEVLAVAQKAGLKYIYHPDPFKSWGHFDLEPRAFPEGVESLRRCVERAKAVGIRVGAHTLSNFIHPHDPYVRPVPDPRLVCTGRTRLTAAVDENATTIPVADPNPFRNKQILSAAILDREVIRYDSVSATEPWTLLGCRRGSFGSTPAAHQAGAEIGKLWDHDYRVLFPNLELQDEISARLTDLWNRAGLRQISFDGLEGCQVTGEDEYAEARFVKKCFDGWRLEVISDSSQLKHYTWHIHTRMNWGEPWGKAMREGMPEYRFKNQDYFRRNLLPPMLGWFQIQAASAELEATRLDDVEWVLAKCAGFDAGCAWVTSVETLAALGDTSRILEAIRQWDRARHEGAFSDEQKARLRSTQTEFQLGPVGDGRWQLTPLAYSPPLRYQPATAATQPAGMQVWTVENRFDEQPLQFVLRVIPDKAEPAFIANPTFEIADRTVTFPAKVPSGHYLSWEGTGEWRVCDANWRVVSSAKAEFGGPVLRSGSVQVRFRCEGPAGKPAPSVEIRLKTAGSPEYVTSPRAGRGSEQAPATPASSPAR